jgi:hypothetical protein
MNMEWISVKDRLPEDRTGTNDVLVLMLDGNMMVANYHWWVFATSSGRIQDSSFWCLGEGYECGCSGERDEPDFSAEITHWTPLPEPPK